MITFLGLINWINFIAFKGSADRSQKISDVSHAQSKPQDLCVHVCK